MGNQSSRTSARNENDGTVKTSTKRPWWKGKAKKQKIKNPTTTQSRPSKAEPKQEEQAPAPRPSAVVAPPLGTLQESAPENRSGVDNAKETETKRRNTVATTADRDNGAASSSPTPPATTNKSGVASSPPPQEDKKRRKTVTVAEMDAKARARALGARTPTASPPPKKVKASNQATKTKKRATGDSNTPATSPIPPINEQATENAPSNTKKFPAQEKRRRNTVDEKARARALGARTPTASPPPKKTKASSPPPPSSPKATNPNSQTVKQKKRSSTPASNEAKARARALGARSPTASPPPKKTKAMQAASTSNNTSATFPLASSNENNQQSTKQNMGQKNQHLPCPEQAPTTDIRTTPTHLATEVSSKEEKEPTVTTTVISPQPVVQKQQRKSLFSRMTSSRRSDPLLSTLTEEEDDLTDSSPVAPAPTAPASVTNSSRRQSGALFQSTTSRPAPMLTVTEEEDDLTDSSPVAPAPVAAQTVAPSKRRSSSKTRSSSIFQSLTRRPSPLVTLSDGEDDLTDDPVAPPVAMPPAAPSKRGSSKRRSSSIFKSLTSRRFLSSPMSDESDETEEEPAKKRSSSLLSRLMGREASEELNIVSAKRESAMLKSGTRGSLLVSIARKRSESRRSSLFTTPVAERNSSNYTPIDVNEAYRKAPKSKWRMQKVKFSGRFDSTSLGKLEEIKGKKIDKGIKKFKANPDKYVAMIYETSLMFARSKEHFRYTYVHREGTTRIIPLDVETKGPMTIMLQEYQHLPSLPNNQLPSEYRDHFTWDMTFQGKLLHSPENPPILPGRGMGAGDTPNLKIIGDIDPSDICQGDVGDCWLLSAISSLAEFDGAIKRLFRKTRNLDFMPSDKPSAYIITLYDLETWKEVDIVMDESLCAHPTRKGDLLGSKISDDGEMWVCYLEKAFVIHCGGSFDDLDGGHCTHAWSMLTGCREQYFIRKNYRTGKYYCSAKYDMFTQEWKKLCNTPSERDVAGLEPCPWPEVGGGGSAWVEISEDEMFMKMHAWDQADFIVGASSKNTEEDGVASGMIRNHCYSVIDAFHHVAGTKFDLFKIRNPWGFGEIEDGLFCDNGSGWEQYPEIKAELKPVVADDGIFYLTKEEFFKNYDHIFLSASDMSAFKED